MLNFVSLDVLGVSLRIFARIYSFRVFSVYGEGFDEIGEKEGAFSSILHERQNPYAPKFFTRVPFQLQSADPHKQTYTDSCGVLKELLKLIALFSIFRIRMGILIYICHIPMPLFFNFFCFLHGCRYEYIEHTIVCLGFSLWMVGNMPLSLFVEKMSCCDCCGLKSVEELCHLPTGLEPLPYTSVALTAQYLNVRQR
jgi:hypothetical protein